MSRPMNFFTETDVISRFPSLSFRPFRYSEEEGRYVWASEAKLLTVQTYSSSVFGSPGTPKYDMFAQWGICVNDKNVPTKACIHPDYLPIFLEYLQNQRMDQDVLSNFVTYPNCYGHLQFRHFPVQYDVRQNAQGSAVKYGSSSLNPQSTDWTSENGYVTYEMRGDVAQVVTLSNNITSVVEGPFAVQGTYGTGTELVPSARIANVCVWMRKLPNTSCQTVRPLVSETLFKKMEAYWIQTSEIPDGDPFGMWNSYPMPSDWRVRAFPSDVSHGIAGYNNFDMILCTQLRHLTNDSTGVWGGNLLSQYLFQGSRTQLNIPVILLDSHEFPSSPGLQPDAVVALRHRVKFSYGPSQLKNVVNPLIQESDTDPGFDVC